MGFLFGHLYDSQCKFTHDQAMFRRMASAAGTKPQSRPISPERESMSDEVGRAAALNQSLVTDKTRLSRNDMGLLNAEANPRSVHVTAIQHQQNPASIADSANETSNQSTRKRRWSDQEFINSSKSSGVHSDNDGEQMPTHSLLQSNRQMNKSIARTVSPEDYSEAWKREAFEAALGNNPTDWNDITLVSVSGHQQREEEL